MVNVLSTKGCISDQVTHTFRYAFEGEVQYECQVPVEVTYAVQVKGEAKSVYHDDSVEVKYSDSIILSLYQIKFVLF